MRPRQPADLWLLRGAVGEALAAQGREADERRLRASLATLFPQGAAPSRC
ncbi:MAG: hypothetical protein MZW92_08870 [Comamonadaceae bacterium]|nr:hypothetical protein [Comamonadaceae bacterium]